jgi:alginate O-acetyltransferase complex protein AlgI
VAFNSFVFALFYICILLFSRLPTSWRVQKTGLLVASYLFYAAWSPPFVILLWVSTLADWFLARAMHRSRSQRRRRLYLVGSLAVNLGLLGYFKYAEFLLDNFSTALSGLGIDYTAPDLGIVLPVGISFYTFQTLSYTIDIYRRKMEPWHSFLDYALYVAFFPQLVAGPIVRAAQFLPQCVERTWASARQVGWGLTLLIIGLFQKVVLADRIFAPVADAVYARESVTALEAWLGTFAFAGQILCDFSGYSTCAIGVALAIGFALPDNFRFPYAAVGFSDFWRRWHISLSSWLRDYLYIPLGGNRRGPIRTYINLSLTMLLGGLWHGTSWNFVIWGALHGIYLIIERLVRPLGARIALLRSAWLTPVYAAITLLGVMIAWVFFRSPDFAQSSMMISAMIGGDWTAYTLHLTDWLAVAAISAVLIGHWLVRSSTIEAVAARLPAVVIALIVALLVFFLAISPGADRAFIYFQF